MNDPVKDDVGTFESKDLGTTPCSGLVGKVRHFDAGKGIDGFTPGMWHHLAVSLKGEDMIVTVDGKEVTRVKCEGYANVKNAMTYLLSSYPPKCFDNLSVTP
jgi:hypothetical protein